MYIANEVRSAKLAKIIQYATSARGIIIIVLFKMHAPKIRPKKSRVLLPIFVEHGIMAHNP